MRYTGRRGAYEALALTDKGAYSNLALKEVLPSIGKQDKAFASALFYTTLENLMALDFTIAHYCKGSCKTAARRILRLGLCQLFYLSTPAFVACDQAVALARELGKGGMGGFINGVMRSAAAGGMPPFPQEAAQRLSVEYSFPLWLAQRWLERYGPEDARRLMAFKERGVWVRPNPFGAKKLSAQALSALLTERGHKVAPSKFLEEALLVQGLDPGDDRLFLAGEYTVQSQGSMLICKAASPKPGQRVLDACAAPGGKSAYLAALMGEGEIVALDLHEHRVALIQNTAARLGIPFIHAAQGDATAYHPQYDSAFDVVLVDAPCSGLGTFSTKPDIKYSATPEKISQLSQLQGAILGACSRYVKKGGVLVYSTCTLGREENEDVVNNFLQTGDFYLDDLSPYVPFSPRRCSQGLQLAPHTDGCGGFYMARLVRS